MRYLIALILILSPSFAFSKEFVKSFKIAQNRQWISELANKNSKRVNHKISIVLNSSKDVSLIKQELSRLKIDATPFVDFFDPNTFHLQIATTKDQMKNFVSFLDKHKIQIKKDKTIKAK